MADPKIPSYPMPGDRAKVEAYFATYTKAAKGVEKSIEMLNMGLENFHRRAEQVLTGLPDKAKKLIDVDALVEATRHLKDIEAGTEDQPP